MATPIPPETLAVFSGNDLQARIFYDKYAARDLENRQIETLPSEMWTRIAREIASVEPDEQHRTESAEHFRWLLDGFRMIPGGRIMTGAGNHRNVTLANCYVMPSPKDQIDGPGGIFRMCEEMAATYKRGGGCGVDLSTLRPNGTPTRNAAITSSGAVSFIHLFSATTGTIGQRGRRGALMITLADTHPDILAFVQLKRNSTAIKYANLSVRVSDALMRAVDTDTDWPLEFLNPEDHYHVTQIIKARALWDEIITGATNFAEPGVLFWDTMRRGSTSEYAGMDIVSTNPCSEIPQGPYHNCTLANLNLATFVADPFTPQARINMDELMVAVAYTVRFLDNVLDYNADRHALPEQQEASAASRRIGLGFTGLADLFCQLGIRYDSDTAVQLADELFAKIKTMAYSTSVLLASEKGPFPLFDRDRHLASAYFASFPPDLLDAIRATGLRNVALLTVPPVGSGAALAGVSSGIEPIFALKYTRRSESLSRDEFHVTHPLVTRYREITRTAAEDPLPPYFQTAHEIPPEARIAVQAAIQRHIDQGISSTVNVPRDTTASTVARIYRAAWEAGCKGITVYREGSRDGILLTAGEATSRTVAIGTQLTTQINRMVDGRLLPQTAHLSPRPTPDEITRLSQAIDALLARGTLQLELLPDRPALRPRPDILPGITFSQEVPEGRLQITINEIDDEAFEVITNVGKAGSDISAWAQALSRLLSVLFRLDSLVPIADRRQIIIDQLAGITGSKTVGFGPDRVGSGPDGMARVFLRYAALIAARASQTGTAGTPLSSVGLLRLAHTTPVTTNGGANGNLCPRCQQFTLINDEGCIKCACGHKEC